MPHKVAPRHLKKRRYKFIGQDRRCAVPEGSYRGQIVKKLPVTTLLEIARLPRTGELINPMRPRFATNFITTYLYTSRQNHGFTYDHDVLCRAGHNRRIFDLQPGANRSPPKGLSAWSTDSASRREPASRKSHHYDVRFATTKESRSRQKTHICSSKNGHKSTATSTLS
jgi:hypothetical protein